MKPWITVLALSGVLVFGGVYHWINSSLDFTFHQSHSIQVKPGEGFFSVLGRLNQEEKLPLLAVKLHLKSKGWGESLKPGEYEISKGEQLGATMKKFVQGQVKLYKVVIPEGYNIFEIAELFQSKGIIDSKEEFISLAMKWPSSSSKGHQSLEGFLFPSTYHFPKNISSKALIETLHKTHKEKRDQILSRYPLPKGYTVQDIVTLASVVEKETGAPWERPLIASVFWNRLKKKMRLQSDPTTIYGQWIKNKKRLKNIRKKHLLESTPYNTYMVKALPAGPISNPGEDALEAVLNPKESSYLYFVSKNDGTHYFSKTYREHQRAVRKFQLSRRARQGKSWRDLSDHSGG